MRLVTKLLPSIRTRFCKQSFRTVSNLSPKLPSTFSICGKEYQTDEWTNITPRIVSFVDQRLHQARSNPLCLIADGIKSHFNEFDIFEYPSPVVDLEANFDSLLIAKDHVSRAKADTYYVNSNLLLRSHTSAHQAHCLKKGSNAFVCIADVFRRDAIDKTHFPVFHQCEVLKLCDFKNAVNSKASTRTDSTQEFHVEEASRFAEADCKQSIENYVKKLLGDKIKMRWVNAFFPFTHPSFELEIFFNNDWLEILGCGVIEHKLLTNVGVEDKVGWALGFGLERLAMLKYSIPDIRLFWTKDSGFLSQFKDAGPWDAIQYKPVSVYPQCFCDVSFWLPSDTDFSPNDFYDLVRSVGGDVVEQVNLVDDFTNKKGRRSNCYRIIYRSNERTLTQSEVNKVHEEIAETARSELNVEIR